MKLAVIGRTQMLLGTARLFAQRGHQVVLVATCKAAPEYTATEADFAAFATQQGAAFLATPRLADQLDAVRAAGADIAISMNWPAILGEELISLFPFGILNAHPGDLPRYRGNACPNWAILQGEDHVTLTIHQMAPGELDSGDVVLKHHIPLGPRTTVGQVYDVLEAEMPALYLEAAEGLAEDRITPQKQSTRPEDILRVYPRLPQDSALNWQHSAEALDRMVRASGRPFAGAYTWFAGHKLVVWQAQPGAFAVPSLAAPGQVTAIDRASGAVTVACGDGVLSLTDISYRGVRTQRPAEIIRSMRGRLGLCAEEEIALLRSQVAQLSDRLTALENTVQSEGEDG